VEVSVTVRDSQATIHFGAAQAETRALLEASIPKLREMLAAQGFNLMDASVSQGFSHQARPDAPTPSRGGSSAPEPEVREAARITALGLLDTYA
jgi:flagellar hook-length control protein FliK